MLIGQGAIDAAKIGVTIALRYACQRPQFGNKTIMTYLTHQRRLLPALATTYALHLAMQNLKVRLSALYATCIGLGKELAAKHSWTSQQVLLRFLLLHVIRLLRRLRPTIIGKLLLPFGACQPLHILCQLIRKACLYVHAK